MNTNSLLQNKNTQIVNSEHPQSIFEAFSQEIKLFTERKSAPLSKADSIEKKATASFTTAKEKVENTSLEKVRRLLTGKNNASIILGNKIQGLLKELLTDDSKEKYTSIEQSIPNLRRQITLLEKRTSTLFNPHKKEMILSIRQILTEIISLIKISQDHSFQKFENEFKVLFEFVHHANTTLIPKLQALYTSANGEEEMTKKQELDTAALYFKSRYSVLNAFIPETAIQKNPETERTELIHLPTSVITNKEFLKNLNKEMLAEISKMTV